MTTHAISIPTPFTDISELAENFASRVDEERLMLPHAEDVPEGEWVQFIVTLGDGTTALAGVGRCSQAFDNGEDRPSEHRYDIVMDSLQLDEMSQVYFERILTVRATQMGEEPTTGEVAVPADVEEVAVSEPPPPVEEDATYAGAFEDLSSMEAQPIEEVPEDDGFVDASADVMAVPADAHEIEEVPAASDWEAEGAYTVGADDVAPIDEDLVPASAGPAPMALAIPDQTAIYEVPGPVAPSALPSSFATATVLTRRALMSSWSPEPLPRMDPSPSSGLFDYAMGAGLPQPALPPRPEIDPSMRVRPAPRPGDPLQIPALAAAGAYEAHHHHASEEEEYEAAAYVEGQYAEGQYEEAEGAVEYDEEYDQDATQDGDYRDYETADPAATREVEIGELPEEDGGYGDETMQVGIHEEDDE